MKYPSLKKRIASVVIKWSIASTCYSLAPLIAFIPPFMVEPTAIDRAIPCIPGTVFIYLTLYFQVMFCLLSASNIILLRCMLMSYLWMTGILAAFFIAVPIRVPHYYYKSVTFSDSVLNWLWKVDVASNCLPSGHVAYSLLGPIFLFAYGEKSRVFSRWFFLMWGILLSLSTLTTKQHLVGDVLCGAFLALAFGWIWGMYAREQVVRRLKGKDLKKREKWRRKRFKRKRVR